MKKNAGIATYLEELTYVKKRDVHVKTFLALSAGTILESGSSS